MSAQRIWFASVVGMSVTLIFGLSYGLFAVLLPIVILMNTSKWHSGLAIQIILTVIWVSLEVAFVVGFLQPYPALMTVTVALIFLSKCIAMMNKTTYLFGYGGLLIGSIMLLLSSYGQFDLEEFSLGLLVSTISTVFIVALACYLFPEKKMLERSPVKAPKETAKNSVEPNEEQNNKHFFLTRQVALGWTVSMSAFILFQLMDLSDSIPALIAILIVMSPMTLAGVKFTAKSHLFGSMAGCFASLIVQITLYSLSNNGVLFIMAFAIAAGPFCFWLGSGTSMARYGFSAMASLTVPFTTVFIPEQQDVLFTILYRFNCILVAIICTTLTVWLIDKYLDYRNKQKYSTALTQ